MRRFISFLLVVGCVINLVGCQFRKPSFEDFSDYKDSFLIVRDYLLDSIPAHNDAASSSDYLLTVQLNDDILSISDSKPKNEAAIIAAAAKLNDKGLTFVNVKKDYMFFWEDETRYYGILWSTDPKSAISDINNPYMKSRKLDKEWYEVGALDSI